MRRCFPIVLILAFLLCGCRAEPDWETVDDAAVQVSAPAEPPYVITYSIPADASMEPLSARNCGLYVGEGGEYEIMSDVISASSLDDALRQVSGFGLDELDVIETSRFGLPEYRFAWSSASDEGEFVSEASLVQDGGYYYALVFSTRQGLNGKYDECAEAVFASFGLYGDENF